MIRFVDLQGAFDALYHTKKDDKEQYTYCHPESIPLYPVSSIVPPLHYRRWPRFILCLLEDRKPVMPEMERIQLPLIETQVAQ